MGGSLAKLCTSYVPNPRRNSRAHAASKIRRPSSARRRRRLEDIRSTDTVAALALEEGFVLGMQVGKLKNILEALDPPDIGRPQRATAVPAQDREGANFRATEPVLPVSQKTHVPKKVEDDKFEVVAKAPHTLEEIVQTDFKPWLQVPGHFEFRSHDSLP